MRAFLVDIFHGLYHGKSVIYAAGRLENGETFGLLDDRVPPCFYIRCSDTAGMESLVSKYRGQCASTNRTTMDGEPVLRLTMNTVRDLRSLEKELDSRGVRTYEADLDYAMLYRITRCIEGMVDLEGAWQPSRHVNRFYINPTFSPAEGKPDLRILALDIETDAQASRLLGLSLVFWTTQGSTSQDEVLLIGPARPDDPLGTTAVADEKQLLLQFRERVIALDPDIMTGWNVIDFDLTVLEKLYKKHGIEFNLGRTKETSFGKPSQYFGQGKMVLRGRQVLDALHLVRHSLSSFEDLRLNTVAQELLGRGKTLAIEEWEDAAQKIEQAWRLDRAAFCAYVLEDSRLVRDILIKQDLLDMTITRSMLTNLALEKAWGSVVAFDALYIGALHQRKMVAPTRGIDMGDEAGGTGGLILKPVVGLHEHVLVFDFKSLYPSVMRTFNIDPVAFIQGQAQGRKRGIVAPNGAIFSREPAILPGILQGFFKQRAEAKARGQAAEAYSYKIIMNSFYGVLATDACRFADRQLADAITTFGQKLLLWTQAYFTERGFQVLYGDTDSLFVAVPGPSAMSVAEILPVGQELCREANVALAEALRTEYQVSSHMELEFEEYFRYFFLPADRQGEGSRAKNYAGLQVDERNQRLEIKGMEAVRSDWTPLAKRLQRDLLAMLFQKTPPRVMVTHIQALVRALHAGRLDDELIYRKRIRKPLEAYTRTTPPHIKAARLLPRTVRVVRYLMTEQGPQPLGFVKAPVDYEHYRIKQILPIVEGLAPFAGFNADEACSGQTGFIFKDDFHGSDHSFG
ncbi:MAG TPA: DNA polymerase II [Oligoflexus sp.]|uniref:DNA polymerase II n=1 Tax=Oligoflexus sp. TaxID=1971216 RepID=UPI002D5FB233|nr:DNA polymerase II [Oligoflexus sp.]HYX34393.1 DNA polymerase II [Oligoflexus sp.]